MDNWLREREEQNERKKKNIEVRIRASATNGAPGPQLHEHHQKPTVVSGMGTCSPATALDLRWYPLLRHRTQR